ncbi:hypothetical protein ACIQ7D_01100 [Streptomyces sp. NPDC096310]|uniref:hypothetical protein n=1 Tax=Streptomyces sp. NPDC096310 TaxID=3366082 RepID=UPI0037FE469C
MDVAPTDWRGQPVAGDSKVLRATHRHGASGQGSTEVSVFTSAVALAPAGEPRALTLTGTTRPRPRLFALSSERPKP